MGQGRKGFGRASRVSALFSLLIGAACVTASAAERAQTHSDIAQFVPAKQRVASRVDADITGDGAADAVFVTLNEADFEATVTVLMRLQSKAGTGQGRMEGFQSVDTLKLELTPHGPPTVAVKNSVLIVESTTGGNSVRTGATYRYRFDADEGRMRLTGIDAERTASTNAIKLSWNLLTGTRIVRRGKRDPAAFIYGPETKSVQKSDKVWMSSTPSADELIDKLVR